MKDAFKFENRIFYEDKVTYKFDSATGRTRACPAKEQYEKDEDYLIIWSSD